MKPFDFTCLTDHYFETDLVTLHYYRFGNGKQPMLCFHGFGMHGKQFLTLEAELGDKYTFYGFDLFFHKQTKLKDQSLAAVKRGISKPMLVRLIADFCHHMNINRFSVIGYSLGTLYTAAITERIGHRIDEYIVAAPAHLNPGTLVKFFGKNKIGRYLLQKLVLSEKALINILRISKWARLIDATGRDILYKEINTAELRFNFYACFAYLRPLEPDEDALIESLEKYNIRSIFIFGERDKMFPAKIGKAFFAKFKQAEIVLLNAGHEMINKDLSAALSRLLL